MIGKPEWFTHGRYDIFGIRPKNWKGFVYIFAPIILLLLVGIVSFISPMNKLYVYLAIFIAAIADNIHIRIQLRKNPKEKQKLRRFMAERYSWSIAVLLGAIILLTLKDYILLIAYKSKPIFWLVIAAFLVGITLLLRYLEVLISVWFFAKKKK